MFYNYDALKAAGPVFIVEDIGQVSQIRTAGGQATALNGEKLSALAAQVTQDKLTPDHIILTVATDLKDVDKATSVLSAGGISYSSDLYLFESENIVPRITSLIENAEAEIKERNARETEEIKKESAAYALNDFVKKRLDDRTQPDYKTGFTALDKILDGGLHAGLYTIGAISSLGKTTFALQVMDHIAQAGQDVLIFSLEMARDELISKSISRNTFIEGIEENAVNSALTTRQIINGKRYAAFTEKQRELLDMAIVKYQSYADKVFISEGVGDIGVEQIRQKVERHIKRTHKTPVILIDYLQILAAADIRASDKQIVDKNILELKRLSRDYKIPVVCISSFNRQSYTDPVNLASFKESGAVEYSADVLIGLQFYGMDYKQITTYDRNGNEVEKWESQQDRDNRIRKLIKEQELNGKEGRPQRIQVKVLKNRNGYRDELQLDFYPKYNYFTGVNYE